jgi:hypothetical protein
MCQYWIWSAQFQLFLRVPVLLSQPSGYLTSVNNVFQRVMPDQWHKLANYLWQYVKIISALKSTKYLFYFVASLPITLALIWNRLRYVNKWGAILLEGKQRLCLFTNTLALSVTTNCQIAWHKIEQNIFQNNQLYIYFNITFYHHGVAVHSPSILCIKFHIFRSFLS